MSSYARVEDTHVSGSQVIDNLIHNSLNNDDEYLRLKWIPSSEFSHIDATQTFIDQKFSYAKHKYWHEKEVILLLLGNHDNCTPAFVNEFARVHSIPTHK